MKSLVALLALCGTAAADTNYYGWQPMISDGVAAAIAGSSYGIGEGTPGIILGSAIYLFGAPAIHLEHDDDKIAAISLGIRAGVPALGAALGVYVAPDGHGRHYAIVGTLIGVGLAALVDDTVLSLGVHDVSISRTRRVFSIGGRF